MNEKEKAVSYAKRERNKEISPVTEAWKEAAIAKAREMGAIAGAQVGTELGRYNARAVQRVAELQESTDEQVATKNSHFIINHAIGTPTAKSISRVERINIDVIAQ